MRLNSMARPTPAGREFDDEEFVSRLILHSPELLGALHLRDHCVREGLRGARLASQLLLTAAAAAGSHSFRYVRAPGSPDSVYGIGIMAEELQDFSGNYLPKLQALFYAVFDPHSGPRVVHQVPEGSIATALSAVESRSSKDHEFSASQGGESEPSRSNRVMFDLSSILDFVIPQPELCDRLITKATHTYKILGYPMRIVDQSKYSQGRKTHNRNTFTFNLCFVFDRDDEIGIFEPVVRKAARFLASLEVGDSLLSDAPAEFRIQDLIEQLYLDLNVYSESSAAVGFSTLDLVLFPFLANPPQVELWDVPVAVVNLAELRQGDWDLTLFKLCTFIDGVNHIRRIAELAHVDPHLARLCIQHLRYYGAVILTDLFQYSNRYCLNSSFADASNEHEHASDEQETSIASECEQYVAFGTQSNTMLCFGELCRLYASIQPHCDIGEWCKANFIDTKPLDVRRFVQFGCIKGFLRRVYAFPVWLSHPNFANDAQQGGMSRRKQQLKDAFSDNIKAIRSPDHAHATYNSTAQNPFPTSLALMLDGTFSTDAICVKYGISLHQLLGILKQIGGVAHEDSATSDFGTVHLVYK